jgi:class 3 adenylate cyclase/tetratricopeptide (TPR) repeat protein
MSDKVTRWLEQQGFGQFAPVFADQQIDWEILSELCEDDLEKLRIPLGPRKKIVKAIATLHAEKAESQSSTAFSSPDFSQPPSIEADAGFATWERMPGERKPVTMLFADITGSTALTEKLDSEETHDLLYGATRCMCEAVENNGGVVCRFMGDGIMAMFGAPLASEHHAINACRAALGMQQAIRDYSNDIEVQHGTGLEIRVGLHSGEVVVLTVGEGENLEYDASGPTVPVAARLEQAAESGQIYISAATHRLLQGRAEVGALKPISVKGVSEPVSAFVLRSVRSIEEAARESPPTPFVGRSAEVAQQEFARLAGSRGMACHGGLVLDFGVGRGEDAIRTLVRSLLDIPRGTGKANRKEVADAIINDGLLERDQRVFLNDLLDLPQPVELRALYDALDNDSRNQNKQKVVTDLLKLNASRRPLIAVVEDVHWADPLTLEHLAALAGTIRDSAAILVMTSRIEGDPLDSAWRGATGGVALMTLDLGPLREEEAREMAATSADITSEFVHNCIERSGCNPLFLEHLLQSATDTAEELPTSLQTLVAARVDRLGAPDKQAVRAAAVLGQRFHEDALRYLVDAPDYDCKSLVMHRLVKPDGDAFLFSHALVQESVLSSLLRKERRNLHRRAAQWYAEHDSTLHAQHLDRADDPDASRAYLEAAWAQTALFHFGRASSLISRGIELVGDQQETHAALRELEGSVRIGLGETREAVEAFEMAAALATVPEDRSRALIGVAHCFRDLGEYERGLDVLERAHDETARLDLAAPLSEIHHYRGNIFFLLHDHERCLDEQKLALELARRSGSKELEAHAYAGLARASYAAGRMRSGYQYARHGCLELCRREGFEQLEFTHMHMSGFGPYFDNDHETALEYYLGGVANAPSVGAHRSALIANAFAGELYLERGQLDAARQRSEESERLATLIGERRYLPFVRGTLGLILVARGERSRAQDELEQAWEQCEPADMGFHGLVLIGAMARAAMDTQRRQRALELGDRMAARACNGHSRIRFFRDAMEVTLAAGEWDDAERYAQRLEELTEEEPLAYCNLFIGRARALAAFGRGERNGSIIEELQRLCSEAERVGLVAAVPLLSEALARAS